jgi:hypothetical protein
MALSLQRAQNRGAGGRPARRPAASAAALPPRVSAASAAAAAAGVHATVLRLWQEHAARSAASVESDLQARARARCPLHAASHTWRCSRRVP